MRYAAPDMSDRLIALLQAKGYRMHTNKDNLPAHLQAPGCIPEFGYWFSWMVDGMASCETGETCSTELEAWGSAMEHFFANASIPLHVGPVAG